MEGEPSKPTGTRKRCRADKEKNSTYFENKLVKISKSRKYEASKVRSETDKIVKLGVEREYIVAEKNKKLKEAQTVIENFRRNMNDLQMNYEKLTQDYQGECSKQAEATKRLEENKVLFKELRDHVKVILKAHKQMEADKLQVATYYRINHEVQTKTGEKALAVQKAVEQREITFEEKIQEIMQERNRAIADATEATHQLNQKITQKNEQCRQLATKLSTLGAESEAMKNLISKLENVKSLNEKEVLHLRKENEEIKQLMSTNSEREKKLLEETKTKNIEYEKELHNLQAKHEETETFYTEALKQIESLKTLCDSTKDERDDLLQVCEDLQLTSETVSKKIKLLENTIENLEEKLRDDQELLKELEIKNRNLEKTLASTTADLKVFVDEDVEKNKLLASSKDLVSELEQENAKLVEDCKVLKEDKEESEKIVEKLVEENSLLQKTINEVKQKHDNEAKNANEIIQKLEAEKKEYQQSMAQLQSAENNIKSNLAQQEEEIKNLLCELEKGKKAINDMSTILSIKEENLINVSEKLQSTLLENEKLQKELEMSTGSSDKAVQELQAALQLEKNTNQDLRDALNDEKSKNESMKTSLEGYLKGEDALKMKITTLQQNARKSEDKIKLLKSEKTVLNKTVANIKKEVKSKEKSLENTVAELNMLKEEISTQKALEETFSAEKNTLEEEKEILVKKLESESKKVAAQELKIAELEKREESLDAANRALKQIQESCEMEAAEIKKAGDAEIQHLKEMLSNALAEKVKVQEEAAKLTINMDHQMKQLQEREDEISRLKTPALRGPTSVSSLQSTLPLSQIDFVPRSTNLSQISASLPASKLPGPQSSFQSIMGPPKPVHSIPAAVPKTKKDTFDFDSDSSNDQLDSSYIRKQFRRGAFRKRYIHNPTTSKQNPTN